jgi:oligoribonuclease NrnB/cAMP/cGMP phosphodiesterase (DHH superfamily)
MQLLNEESIKDAILVTHAGCMDGSGCAIMFLRAGGKRENIKYVAAGMLEKFLKDELDTLGDRFIVFADIGIQQANVKYADMLEKRGNCVLLDHHKTAAWLDGRPWCWITMDKCGTHIAYDYFNKCGLLCYVTDIDWSIKRLVKMIEDHDLWKSDMEPEAISLATYCVFFGQDTFVDNFHDRLLLPDESIFYPQEKKIMEGLERKRDAKIQKLIEKANIKKMEYDSREITVAYVVSSEPNTSLLLNRVFETRPDVDVACQINLDFPSVSMRTRSDTVDVSKICGRFGGGGHAKASGHRVDESIYTKVIEEVHG